MRKRAKEQKFIERTCKGCGRKKRFSDDDSRVYCAECRRKRSYENARVEKGDDYASRVLNSLSDDRDLI